MNWFLIVTLLKQKMLLNLDKYCHWVVRSYSNIDMLFLINRILYLPVLDIKINLIFFFQIRCITCLYFHICISLWESKVIYLHACLSIRIHMY